MIRTKGELVFMSLCYVLLPAFLMHINGTFGTVINMDPGFLATDRTFMIHCLHYLFLTLQDCPFFFFPP